MTDQDLIREAIEAQVAAEAAEAEGSPHRWCVADRYAALSQRGWTQQRIATACGVSQATVSTYIRAAITYVIIDERPSFWHAYEHVRTRNRKKSSSPKTPEEWMAMPSDSRRWKKLNQIVQDLETLRREWGDEPPEDVPINEAARRVREYNRLIAFLSSRRDEFAEKGKKLLPKETP